METGKTGIVISHTHWDREWYLDLEKFRLRLVELVDALLDILDTQPRYIFHLDAQSIVLDDYVEIRPYERDRIDSHIASGRLLVGPWYVQNDFFLVSAEATVRNLKQGIMKAESHGASMRSGYMPDQFGLAGQLPQILGMFGIDSAVFGRGYTFWENTTEGRVHRRKPTELWWEAPDGSRILGVHLCNWYNNAQRFSADRDRSAKYVNKIIKDFGDRPLTPYLLMMNGVDHLEAQADLLPILDDLSARLPPEISVRQGSLPNYLELVKSWLEQHPEVIVPRWKGELRQGADYDVLSGTLSSRIYLKILNDKAQNLLEKAVEPLFAMAEALGCIGLWPHDELAYIWRLLMQNHPHDSICGCSVDSVHDRMEDRFARFSSVSTALLERGMAALQNHTHVDPQNYSVLVVNTLTFARQARVQADIFFPEDIGKVDEFSLTDPDGNQVAYSILSFDHRAMASLSPVNLPGTIHGCRYRIEFDAGKLPSLGYTLFSVTPNSAGLGSVPRTVVSTDHVILENGLLRLVIHDNGAIDIGAVNGSFNLRNLISLEDEADTGDSYVHVPADGTTAVQGFDGKVSLCHRISSCRDYCSISGRMLVPESWNHEDKRRSENLVAIPVTVEISLDQGSTRIQARVTVNNLARNHRLRVVFRFGSPLEGTYGSAPFDLVYRPYQEPAKAVRGRDEPTSGLIVAGNWAILTEGLHEYELRDRSKGELALTLLRAVGQIGNDVGTPDTAPEIWLCPGAQCERTIEARFSLVTPLAAGQGEDAATYKPGAALLKALDEEFTAPLVRYDAGDCRRFIGGRPAVQESDLREVFYKSDRWPLVKLPSQSSLLRVEGRNVQVSAVYHHVGSTVVRLYNPTDNAEECRIVPAGVCKEAWFLDGLDQKIGPVDLVGQQGDGNRTMVPLLVDARKVVTIAISPGGDDA